MKKSILILLIFIYSISYSQQITYLKNLNIGNTEEFAEASSGNFIGVSFNNIIKIDKNGDLILVKKIGSNQYVIKGIKKCIDGKFIIYGTVLEPQSQNKSDIFICKIDENFDIIFSKNYGVSGSNDDISDVKQTSDGSFLILDYNIFFKTDENGVLLFSKEMSFPEPVSIRSITISSDGDYYLTGCTLVHFIGYDNMGELVIINLDNNFNFIKAKKIKITELDQDIPLGANLKYVRFVDDKIVSNGFVYANNDNYGLFVVFDKQCNVENIKCYTSSVEGTSGFGYFAVDNEGKYVTNAGGYTPGIIGEKLKIYRINPDLTINWGWQYDGFNSMIAPGKILCCSDGGYMSPGMSLLKINQFGKINCYSVLPLMKLTPQYTTSDLTCQIADKGVSGNISINFINFSVAIQEVCHDTCINCNSVVAPTFDFTTGNYNICLGSCINFTGLNPSNAVVSKWEWTFQGAETPTGNVQNPTNICYNNPGNYAVTLKVTTESGYDTTITKNIQVIKLERGLTNKSLCPGLPVNLNASNHGCQYAWNTGEATQSINVTQSGDYRVTISNGSCSIVDSCRIEFGSLITSDLPNTLYICSNNKKINITTQPCNNCTYSWSNGSNDYYIVVDKPGMYILTKTGPCNTVVDTTIVEIRDTCQNDIFFPNVFIPNSDGRNDFFKPVITEYSVEEYTFHIFNRWGTDIFETSDFNTGWNGNDRNGKPCQQGTYVYLVIIKQKGKAAKAYKGIVNLIR